jgi:cholesterol transport system auxiliary component
MKPQSNNRPSADGFSRRGLLRSGALLIAGGAIAGCSLPLPGQGPAPALYRLTPKSTFRPDLPEVDWQLVVETPVSNASLNSARIALQRSPVQVEYYANAGWVDRAPVMIQTLLIESFENSRRIVGVGRENVGLRADLVLKVELREFEATYHNGAVPDALVTVILKLVEVRRRTIVGFESFSAQVPAENDSLTAIVLAFDAALGKVMKYAVEWSLIAGESYWQTGQVSAPTE